MTNTILFPKEVRSLVAAGSPVAIGISGGKDSCALAIALNEFLDSVGHTGPRVLVHSDLGNVEWTDSIRTCYRLSDRLGLRFLVVRKSLMDRWKLRWRNNVSRWVNLECVKLILPWSTPAMRFCTSDAKLTPICSELSRQFPGQVILSASGIRRDESPNRAKALVFKEQKRLTRKTTGTSGFDWNPLLDWSALDVFEYLERKGFDLHEAYTRYGSSRVSCAFCILASFGDLRAAARCEENHGLYRELVNLEIESTFAFQGSRWLGDVAPWLLDTEALHGLQATKEKARLRMEAEKKIPSHLLYEKGWPKVLPTWTEAKLLCQVRRTVAQAVGLPETFTAPDELRARYLSLMTEKRTYEHK